MSKANARLLGVAFIAIGVVTVIAANDWPTIFGEPPTAPPWVLDGMGLSFFLAGVLGGQWWHVGQLTADALAATMMTSIAVVCGWISLYGAGFQLQIGRSLFSPAPAFLSRTIFGAASLITFALATFGWWRTITRRR